MDEPPPVTKKSVPPKRSYRRKRAIAAVRRRRFWERHRYFQCFLLFLVGAGFMCLVGFGLLVWPYVEEAREHDLSELSDFGGTIRVKDRNGITLGALNDDGRIVLTVDEISLTVTDAIVAAEDRRFYQHHGFDFQGIVRAAIANIRKQEIDQGASTITQQLARNAIPLGSRSFERKLREILLAVRIERNFSKKQILTDYANHVYFGSGFNGLGSAAEGYFGKEASELTPGEAAILTGLIRSPNRLSPFNFPEAARGEQKRVLEGMVEEGMISRQLADAEIERGLSSVLPKGEGKRPLFLLGEVREELATLFPGGEKEGITVELSVDLNLQYRVERLARDRVEAIERMEDTVGESDQPIQCSAFVIENETGRIVSAVASRDHLESEYDRVSLAKRPAGLAFAPLVYATAFDTGVLSPSSLVFDTPISNRYVSVGNDTGVLGEWGTENPQNQFLGEIPVGAALISGKQSATARVGFAIGIESVAALAARAGVETPLNDLPSTFLGASEVSLREMTHAYTSFSGAGIRAPKPSLIDRVTDQSGNLIYARSSSNPERRRAMKSRTADDVRKLLTETLHQRDEGADPSRFGMTGTSFDSEDNWFIGGDSEHTWGVWIGKDTPETIYPDAYSKDTALPLWSGIGEMLPQAGEEITGLETNDQDRIVIEGGETTPETTLPTATLLRARTVVEDFDLPSSPREQTGGIPVEVISGSDAYGVGGKPASLPTPAE